MAKAYNVCKVFDYGGALPPTKIDQLRKAHDRLGDAGVVAFGADLVETSWDQPLEANLLFQVHAYGLECLEIERWREKEITAMLKRHSPKLHKLVEKRKEMLKRIEAKASEIKALRIVARERVHPEDLEAELKDLRDEDKELYNEEKEIRKDLFAYKNLQVSENQVAKLVEKRKEATGKPREKIEEELQKAQKRLKENRERFDGLSKRKQALSKRVDKDDKEIAKEVNRKHREVYGASNLYATTCSEKRKAVEAARRHGGVASRNPGYDGTGSFAVQLQRRNGKYVTVFDLFKEKTVQSCVRLERLPDVQPTHSKLGKPKWKGKNLTRAQKRAQRPTVKRGKPVQVRNSKNPKVRYLLHLRLTRDDQWISVPFTYHQGHEMPMDAEVRMIRLIRKHHRDRKTWHVQFIVARNAGFDQDVAESGACGVHFGWKQVRGEYDAADPEQCGIRVACVEGSDGHREEIILPFKWFMRRWKFAESLAGIQKDEFNAARKKLVAWKKSAKKLPKWFKEAIKTLPNWKSGKKLAGLVGRWGRERFSGDEEIYEVMEAWRKQNAHLWQMHISILRKTNKRRNHFYRETARRLARKYKHLYIAKMKLKDLHKKSNVEEDKEVQEVRHNMKFAALGILRQFMSETGMAVHKCNLDTISHCQHCGEKQKIEASRTQKCLDCHRTWDSTQNAAARLLQEHQQQEQKRAA